jgi:hypothetical protein
MWSKQSLIETAQSPAQVPQSDVTRGNASPSRQEFPCPAIPHE